MVYATQAFAPGPDGRRPEWRDVCRWAIADARAHGYDVLVVDSLERWMGADTSGAAMLDALGELRQGTGGGSDRRLAGIVLHHPPRHGVSPRGASQIDGEVDLLWRLSRREGKSPEDPVRILEWTKHRFQDDAPQSLTVERVWDRTTPGARPTYRLVGGSRAAAPDSRDCRPSPPAHQTPAVTVTPQVSQVLAAYAEAGEATIPEVAEKTGIARQRVAEAVVTLSGLLRVRATDARRVPARGGAPATVYRYTGTRDGAAPTGDAERLLREALDVDGQ